MRNLTFSETMGGAGENDMNWVETGAPGFLAYEDMTITSINITGALVLYLRLTRSGHPSSDIFLSPLALTGAAEGTQYDFLEIFGAGIELKKNEVLHAIINVSGAATATVTVTVSEAKDAVPSMNMRGIRVAGSAAAIADPGPGTPVVTSGNVVLPTNVQYSVLGAFLESTTAHDVVFRKDGRWVASLRAYTAPGLGFTAEQLFLDKASVSSLTGTNQDIQVGILATAADAAGVQLLTVYFLLPTGV